MGCLMCGSLENCGKWICGNCENKILKKVKKGDVSLGKNN